MRIRSVFLPMILTAILSGRAIAVIADPRLEQKVSVKGVQLRLFQITDELTKQTKVTVRTGRNLQDWQIRDIPVTICVSDVRLGQLLNALAHATHTRLHTEGVKAEGGGIKLLYRLTRDAKARQAVDNYTEGVRQEAIDKSSAAWDLLVKQGQAKSADWKETTPGSTGEISLTTGKALAQIIANLPEGAKARVFAGEALVLTPGTFPQVSLLETLQKGFWQKQIDIVRSIPGFGAEAVKYEPSESDKNDLSVIIQLVTEDEDHPVVNLSVHPVRPTKYFGFSNGVNLDQAATANYAYLPTVQPSVFRSGAGFKYTEEPVPDVVDIPKDGKTPLDWSGPVKADFGKLEKASCGDAAICFAEAAGINLVMQDVMSHAMWSVWRKSSLTASTTNLTVLDTFAYGGWKMIPSEKLVIGQAIDWRRCGRELMPFGLLESMKRKADGAGIDLDEFSQVALYSSRQISVWVGQSRELGYLSSPAYEISSIPIYKLYAMLSPVDKDTAKTPEGLALGKFDAGWISGLLVSKKELDVDIAGGTSAMRARRLSWAREVNNKLKDPHIIAGSRLFITATAEKELLVTNQEDDLTFNQHRVTMPKGSIDLWENSITMRDESGVVIIQRRLSSNFPIFSPKRCKELIKLYSKDQQSGKQEKQ